MDTLPKFPTVDEIKKCVPAHCFKKPLLRSLYHLAKDLACLYALYLVLPFVETQIGYFGMFIWYIVAGLHFSAIFLIGHDCAHGSFSEYKWANDLFGHIIHASLLIPFWPWQKTHRLHHTYTQKLGHDREHVFLTKEKYESFNWFIKFLIKYSFFNFIRFNILYLVVGISGNSHVWPWSSLYTTTRERIACAFSTGVFLLFGYLIFNCLCDSSFNIFFKYYLLPLMFHNYWLIMVTYMQHRDENSRVYEKGTWTFVRGQLETIDIVYGMGIDSIMHNVTTGHVTHHLFSRIPHYHLEEATEAVRLALEKYPGAYKRTERYKYWFFFQYQWQVLFTNFPRNQFYDDTLQAAL